MARPPEKGVYECGMAVACVVRAVAWRAVVVGMCVAWQQQARACVVAAVACRVVAAWGWRVASEMGAVESIHVSQDPRGGGTE